MWAWRNIVATAGARARAAYQALASRLFYTPRPWLVTGETSYAPEYPALTALSTLARFPWVWVCVDAIAWDLAGLPLVAVRRERTTSIDRPIRRKITHDPLLDLLERPNAGEDGVSLLAQVFADELLTGNGYLWFPNGAASTAIYRLHPFQTEPIPGYGGLPVAYRVTDRGTGQVQIIPAEQIAHFRGLSWRDDERACLGESVIRCLSDDLTGDLGARQRAAEMAAKGRPDVMFSVKGQLGPEGDRQLRERWERAVTSRWGAFAYGGDVSAQILSWAPKDYDDKTRDEVVRNKVLAAFGVPPTRAGITTASYGASRQEMRAYWERLMARSQRYARVLSRFARAGTAVEFDFSGIESLQVSNTERMAQAEKLIASGATPKAAYDYVGFPDAPVPDQVLETFKPTMPIDRQPTEPQPARDPAVSGPLGTIRAVLDAHWSAARAAYDAAEGTDARLLVRFLAGQLAHALRAAGVDESAAAWWGDEIAATSDEIVRAGGDAWTSDRAAALTIRLSTPARTEARA